MEPVERAPLITKPFVAVTVAAAAFFIYAGILVPLIPQYIENELDGSELGVGLNIAAFAGASIIARGFLGRLVDRYGRRAVMIAGALIAAVAGFAAGQMTSLAPLLVFRGVTGIGEAAVFVGAATLVADLAPPHRRAEAASYFSVSVYGGLGIGPVLSETLLADGRYTLVFAIAGAFAVLSAILAIGVPARVPMVESAGELTASHRFVHRAAVGPGIVMATGIAAFATFSAFIPDYSREVGLSNSGGLFALYAVTCIAVRLFGARLPERLGPRVSVTIALVGIGSGLLLLTCVAAPWSLWVSAAILGFGMAFLYPSMMALTIDRVTEPERAHALSSFTMFFEGGQAVGGLVLGMLADVVGKRSSFLGGVVIVTFGLWALRARVVPAGAARASGRDAQLDPSFVPAAGD